MKILKRLIAAGLILAVLVVIAVFILLTNYKQELFTVFADSLRSSQQIDLRAENIRVSLFTNWPHASVLLSNVEMRKDSSAHDSTFNIKARNLALSFNLRQLLHGKFILNYVSIRDGAIRILKPEDRNPATPHAPRRDSISSEPALTFDLKRIMAVNTDFTFLNKARGQRIHFVLVKNSIELDQWQEGFTGRVTGRIFFDGLLFNPKKGEFLRHQRANVDLRASYFTKEKTLCVKPGSGAVIDNQHYSLSCIAFFGEQRRLALRASGTKLRYEKVAAILPARLRKKLSNFVVKKPFDADVFVVAGLGKREDPGLIVHLSGEHSDLEIGTSRIPYSDVSFHGRLVSIDSTKQRGDMEHAILEFHPLTGKIFDHPFEGRVKVFNLADPYVTVNGRIHIDAAKAHRKPDPNLEVTGRADAAVHYEGPASLINKREFLSAPMKLGVQLHIRNIVFRDRSRPYRYTVNGTATLNKTDLMFSRLSLQTHLADFTIKGHVSNFIDYVLGEKPGFRATFSAHTRSLSLDPLLATSGSGEVHTNVTTKGDTISPIDEPISEKIPKGDFEFRAQLKADKLKARQLTGENASMDLFYTKDFLRINGLKMEACGGRLSAKGLIAGFNKLKADVDVEDVDVQELFRQFENFGQGAVSSDNLRGRMSLNATFKTHLDPRFGVIGRTMSGDVSLHLKEGRLVNFAPIQRLSNFVFRNRDFNDVKFSQLNESFSVNGFALHIHELEVASSILNLYVVSGIYDLKGPSTINLLIPWNNLRRREKDYVPVASGVSADDAKGLRVNFSGLPGKLKLSLGHKNILHERASL